MLTVEMTGQMTGNRISIAKTPSNQKVMQNPCMLNKLAKLLRNLYVDLAYGNPYSTGTGAETAVLSFNSDDNKRGFIETNKP